MLFKSYNSALLKLKLQNTKYTGHTYTVSSAHISVTVRKQIDTERLKVDITRTSVKVRFNSVFICEVFTTFTTAKLFDLQVHWLMRFQFTCCIETLWTFTANKRRHTFMSMYMYLKATTIVELLLANVTCQPCTFIVCFQQMCLELVKPWSSLVKRSEQCSHEYGFAPV